MALANGVYVRVPLPFAREIFRPSTSFEHEPARENLDKLLDDQRVESFIVPLPPERVPATVDWQAVATDRVDPTNRDLRRACYANAGAYIVRHCHVLIALWDGNAGDPQRPSGTAEFVMFKLRGESPVHYPGTNAEPLGFRGECGPVYVIHAPRSKAKPDDPALLTPAGSASILLPARDKPFEKLDAQQVLARRVPSGIRLWRRIKSSLWRKHAARDEQIAELWQFQETCQAVDDFNRDVGATKTSDEAKNDLTAIQAKATGHPHFQDVHAGWLRRLTGVREAAARLSRHLQPRLESAVLWVFLLLGLAAMSMHIYSHHVELRDGHLHHQRSWVIAFVILLFTPACLVGVVWYGRLDERRLDYRTLAEALRIRRAWALAGIGQSVADSYLGQLRGEVSWVRRALLSVCPPPQVWSDQFAALSHDQQRDLLKAVRTEWVNDQVHNFRRASNREHRRATRFRRLGLGLTLIGPLLLLGSAAGRIVDVRRNDAARPARNGC